MVTVARAKAGPGALRPLNGPQPLLVQADDWGCPIALSLHGEQLGVGSTEDHWRIEDEWWRDEPVSRSYYEVLLADGLRMTVFQDNATGKWYRQNYG